MSGNWPVWLMLIASNIVPNNLSCSRGEGTSAPCLLAEGLFQYLFFAFVSHLSAKAVRLLQPKLSPFSAHRDRIEYQSTVSAGSALLLCLAGHPSHQVTSQRWKCIHWPKSSQRLLEPHDSGQWHEASTSISDLLAAMFHQLQLSRTTCGICGCLAGKSKACSWSYQHLPVAMSSKSLDPGQPHYLLFTIFPSQKRTISKGHTVDELQLLRATPRTPAIFMIKTS